MRHALARAAGVAAVVLVTFDEAIAWQRQAIAGARQVKQPALAARLTENLRLYEQRTPCRVPVANGDPIDQPGLRQ